MDCTNTSVIILLFELLLKFQFTLNTTMSACTLRIMSYNCRGAMSSYPYISDILSKCDVLCIQEHHLTPQSSTFLNTIDDQYDASVVLSSSHMEHNPSLRQGGVAILWRKAMGYAISDVCLNIVTDRVVGIVLQRQEQLPVYIFTVYMPSTNATMDDYQQILDILQVIYDTFFEKGIIVISGDFNAQLGSNKTGRRQGVEQNIRGKILEQYMMRNNLCSLVVDQLCTGPMYTYWSDNNTDRASQIDHILIANDHKLSVLECNVFDYESLNTSDHVPVMCKLDTGIPLYTRASRVAYNWSKGDLEAYKQCIREYIISSANSNNLSDTNDIDNLLSQIQGCIISSMDRCIPVSRSRPHQRPYWDADLEQTHAFQKSKRHIWILSGRPRGMNYATYSAYKEAKRQFAKLLKQKQLLYEQSRFQNAETKMELDSRHLWKFLKSHKRGSAPSYHAILHDGKRYCSPAELGSLWSEHYSKLLNESDVNDFDPGFNTYINNEEQQMADTYDIDKDNTEILSDAITVNEVANACKSMPNNKSAGMDNISYESLKYGGYLLYQRLSELYNAIITFAYVPSSMKHSVIIPLYKGKKKPRDHVDSYRGISLSQVINKVLEKIILKRLKPWLTERSFPPAQQQACQHGASSVTLSYVVQEVINNYRNQKSKVFSCFLDIQKAFDSVWWSGLLYKMSQIGIKDKLWFLCRNWLHGSRCSVMINGETYSSFPITRSIKQGGLLSMLMFCISIYDIHSAVVEPPAKGIMYNGEDVSSLTFADDMLLLSSSVSDLQRMLDNAHDYGTKWHIKFSPTKTVCLTFGETKRQHNLNTIHRSFHLGNIKLSEVTHTMYLGNKLCTYNNTSERSKDMSNRAYSYLGSLMSTGFHSLGLSPITNAILWKRLCIPSMLFGCETWGNLSKREYYMFEKAQRSIAKHIQGLTRRTHNEIVLGLLGWHTIQSTIDKCKCMFVCKLINMTDCITKRVFINEMYKMVVYGKTNETVTSDLVRILDKYNLCHYLHAYATGSDFPDKTAWKAIVREEIARVEQTSWCNGLIDKNVIRYRRIQPQLEPNVLYKCLRNNLEQRQSIMHIIMFLTIIENDEPMLCTACGQIVTDSVEHVMVRCSSLINERTDMWDIILDSVEVQAEAALVARDDTETLDILLGKDAPDVIPHSIKAKVYNEVGLFIQKAISLLGI